MFHFKWKLVLPESHFICNLHGSCATGFCFLVPTHKKKRATQCTEAPAYAGSRKGSHHLVYCTQPYPVFTQEAVSRTWTRWPYSHMTTTLPVAPRLPFFHSSYPCQMKNPFSCLFFSLLCWREISKQLRLNRSPTLKTLFLLSGVSVSDLHLLICLPVRNWTLIILFPCSTLLIVSLVPFCICRLLLGVAIFLLCWTVSFSVYVLVL